MANFALSTKRKEQEKVIENLHSKTFGAWVNHKLSRKKYGPLQDVRKDFQDGINLIHLVEVLFDEKPAKWNKEPSSIHHKIENVGIAIDILKRFQGQKLQITPEDITDGNVKLTLGLLWRVISSKQMLSPEDNDKTAAERNKQAKGNLLAFCRKQTEGYEGVQINDFQGSFWDGLGFVALVHKLNPSLISWDEMKNADIKARLTAAFDAAEKIGIPKLLDVDDMLREDESARPDEKCVMTYVSEFPLAYLAQNPEPVKVNKQVVEMPQELSEEEIKAREAEIAKLKAEELERKEKAEKAEKEAEEARKAKEQLQEKKKEKETVKAEIEAKEESLKSKNHQIAEENKRLEDILAQLKKDNSKLKEELAATQNSLIGRLQVTVNECRGLTAMSLTGKTADPYVKLKLDKQEFKTKRQNSTLTPKYTESFELFVSDKRSSVEVSVFNWERVRSDRIMGKLNINIADLHSDGKEETKWFQLMADQSHKGTAKKATLKKSLEEEKKKEAEGKHESVNEATAEQKPAGEVSLTIKFVLGN